MTDKRMITVRLPDDLLTKLDAAIKAGHFSSRAEAIKSGLAITIKQARDTAIVEEFREAYSTFPPNDEDAEIGRAGLLAGAAIILKEEQENQQKDAS